MSITKPLSGSKYVEGQLCTESVLGQFSQAVSISVRTPKRCVMTVVVLMQNYTFLIAQFRRLQIGSVGFRVLVRVKRLILWKNRVKKCPSISTKYTAAFSLNADLGGIDCNIFPTSLLTPHCCKQSIFIGYVRSFQKWVISLAFQKRIADGNGVHLFFSC